MEPHHSELAREKMWARIHLIPVLQAEQDRDQVRRMWADQARERELMGADTKAYNTDRYVLHPRMRKKNGTTWPIWSMRQDFGKEYADRDA